MPLDAQLFLLKLRQDLGLVDVLGIQHKSVREQRDMAVGRLISAIPGPIGRGLLGAFGELLGDDVDGLGKVAFLRELEGRMPHFEQTLACC